MKSLLPLLLSLALWSCLCPADEPPSIEPSATSLVERDILTPLRTRGLPANTFSRRLLIPPRVEWDVEVGGGLRAFRIIRQDHPVLLGLYVAKDNRLLLLDPAPEVPVYVPVHEHPLFKARE